MDTIIEAEGALEHGGANMEAFMDAFSHEMTKEPHNEGGGAWYHFVEIGPRECCITRFRARPDVEAPPSGFDIVYEFVFDPAVYSIRYHIRLILVAPTIAGLAFKLAKKAMKKGFDDLILPQFVAYMQAALVAARVDE